jgi:hypothetical protein
VGSERKPADDLACGDGVADGDLGGHRLERGAPTVRQEHDDDPAPGDRAGEGDHPRGRGEDPGAGRSREVDPAVAGQPVREGWLEASDHDGRLDGPARSGRGVSRGRIGEEERGGQREQQDERDDEQPGPGREAWPRR